MDSDGDCRYRLCQHYDAEKDECRMKGFSECGKDGFEKCRGCGEYLVKDRLVLF